jgi:hypothetical protein
MKDLKFKKNEQYQKKAHDIYRANELRRYRMMERKPKCGCNFKDVFNFGCRICASLIILFSVGCANSPFNYYYVTEIKNAGSGIMLTKCRLNSSDCRQEFIEVTGGGNSPAIQMNNK